MDTTRSHRDQAMLSPESAALCNSLCAEFQTLQQSGNGIGFEPFLSRAPTELRGELLEQLFAIAVDWFRARNLSDAEIANEITRLNPTLRGELQPQLLKIAANNVTQLLKQQPDSQVKGPATNRHSHGLHVRCPHCSNPVELLAETPYEAVHCESCGSNFSLVDRPDAARLAPVVKTLGRFNLVARLGEGAFGAVWKALDTELDRVVAVKIPRRGNLSDREIEQFYREARAAAQLRHPHIVSVHEVGREGDTLFIVSDLVSGADLSDWLKSRRLSFRETAELIATIAEALEYAHQNGIVHRDLKPSNIMIGARGEPIVMDFGLARR
ncbi:MAG TPA: protein kinase, partial [Pirellulales bacterium]